MYKTKGKGLVPLLALLMATVACVFLMRDYAQDQQDKAALFTNADASVLSPPIPFPFVEADQQASSPQAVTPAEFMAGIESGHFKALKISTYPSLFMQTGQVGVEDFWRNKDVLIDAVNHLGGRVVLVDEYGGIAASVASAAMRNFGLNVGFLLGGTTSLSKFGWMLTDSGKDLGGATVSVSDYKKWIGENPDAYVLGITTDREFVHDGWIFGDRTLTLADFVSNYEEIVRSNLGKRFFIVGFETNDSGATPIAVSLLADAGVDVHYVMPNQDEILIKPPYFDAYANDTRTVSVEDAERYILYRDDVEFLDFSERPWPVGVNHLKGRYHHFPMAEVAGGGLASFVAGLNPQKVYIGLAFDRRTAYHSLLAGELLSERGVPWLGRFTRAASLTEPFFSVDDLNTTDKQLAFFLRGAAALAGLLILGNGIIPLALILGITTALPSLLVRRRHVIRNTCIFACESMAYCCVLQAKADYPQVADAYTAFVIANTAFMALAVTVLWRFYQPPIRAFSPFTTDLPAKASLLNVAAERGFRVPKGFVVAPEDVAELCRRRQKAGRYIVRSAAMEEAANHSSTAGVYQSFIASDEEQIPGLVSMVFENFRDVGVDGYALVQPYVEARWYGVIQLQDGDKCFEMVCEIGQGDAVTSGLAAARSFSFPVWDVKHAPALIRTAANALLALMDDGAYSLEFALRADGSLVILQVNRSSFRACAAIRLRQLAKKPVIEVGSSHPDPLSAGIVAALSPGQILAFGHRRFCVVEPAWRTRVTLQRDLIGLGFPRRRFQAVHLMAWVERAMRSPELMMPCHPTVDAVVAAILLSAKSVGRMNRVASALLAAGRATSWAAEARYLASSEVGYGLANGKPAAWQGMPVSPLAGFAAEVGKDDFTADELPSELMLAGSPEHWVKDSTSLLLAMRLASLKPAIASLISEGKAQQLLDALSSQVGNWDAMESHRELAPLVQVPMKFSDVVQRLAASTPGWRLPTGGITGPIISPGHRGGKGVLLIDRCSMDYLSDLEFAVGVLAIEGSITSHLMQHAAAMRLPVIIGADLPDGLQDGTLVTINREGVVQRA
ncbi:hypothetical protein F2S72_01310 [Pseudomonas syringae pv. actinidiae]|nr:hypothetical protein [Pseudomonas syringae pv. actinidiae]